jgi:signal transduction histidine kinase
VSLDGALLDALTTAVSAVSRIDSMAARLQRLVDLAREEGHARYAALGVPDDGGGFAHFVTSGMSENEIEAIGPLPRTHGLLGAILWEGRPYRSPDIASDPRFEWWPAAHPRMRAFLGVPVLADGHVVAAYYLADRLGGGPFTQEDEAALAGMARPTAVAVEIARLYDEREELAVVEERNRVARELHDAVAQTLFSASLLADAAGTALPDRPEEAARQLRQVSDLVQGAAHEVRALIFELRPPTEEAGLVAALDHHVEVLRRVHGGTISLAVTGVVPLRPRLEREVLRIAQGALANAVRHAEPATVEVTLALEDGTLHLTVRDDGRGFDPADPAVRSHHLGITTMEERAKALGGRLRVASEPGSGTTVTLQVPVAT